MKTTLAKEDLIDHTQTLQNYIDSEDKENIAKYLKIISVIPRFGKRKAKVLTYRLVDGLTYNEIGKKMKVCRVRAHQLVYGGIQRVHEIADGNVFY